ncbi:MAG TPA: hypothetical protein VH593_15480 [Ktedonobacteraceae bacterium]
MLFCLLSLLSPLVIGIIVPIFALSFSESFLPFSMVIGLFLSLVLITFSVQRVPPSRWLTHSALALAFALPLVMLVGLVTILVKVIPSLFTMLQTGTSLFYILREDLLILLMVTALVLILVSLKQGLEAKRVTQESLKPVQQQSFK